MQACVYVVCDPTAIRMHESDTRCIWTRRIAKPVSRQKGGSGKS